MHETLYLQNADKIWTSPTAPVRHRDDEYNPAGFEVLSRMQEKHFWYLGRHRFLLAALQRALRQSPNLEASNLSVIDLGGGCGGWIAYLHKHRFSTFQELALGDSSLLALEMARPILPASTSFYQIDLADLQWRDRWDAAFLLDVIEHIPDDHGVMKQIYQSLRPNGLLFLTTPALEFFHTWNDEVAHHQRRYSRRDLHALAASSGFELIQARYFMFFLSPALLLSRWRRPPLESMTSAEIDDLVASTHRVPGRLVNGVCRTVFAAETPLGLTIPFPWGTSILGVYRKPA